MSIKERLICKLASFTRKRRLERWDRFLRIIYNPDKRQKDSIKRILFIDDLLFRIDTASYLEWTLFFYGGYEFFVSKLFERFVQPGCVVADIGANIGIHTLKLGTLVGPCGAVYAFEPHPEICCKLRENIKLNQISCINVVQIGLAEKSGEFILQGFDKTTSNHGTSFLVTDDVIDKNNAVDRYKVRVLRFDDWAESKKLERLDFIKIDVEGIDVEVLNGAMQTISKFKPVIIFEYCQKTDTIKNQLQTFKEVKIRLDFLGYKFYFVKHNYLEDFTEKQLQGNVRILLVPDIFMLSN